MSFIYIFEYDSFLDYIRYSHSDPLTIESRKALFEEAQCFEGHRLVLPLHVPFEILDRIRLNRLKEFTTTDVLESVFQLSNSYDSLEEGFSNNFLLETLAHTYDEVEGASLSNKLIEMTNIVHGGIFF